MRKLQHTCLLTVSTLVFLICVFRSPETFAQKKNHDQTAALFSSNVSGILKNSCIGCHSDMSQGKAKEFLNLSQWDKFTHKEQVKAAKSMGKKVRKGTMPPPMFLEKHPEAALTADQKAEIASWVKSVKKK